MKTAVAFLTVGIIAVTGYMVSQPVGNCPPVDGPKPVYLLDRLNRYVFYECSNGLPILQNCSVGLAFNRKTNICDFPSVTCEPCGQVGDCPAEPSNTTVQLRDGCNVAVYYRCATNGSDMMRCDSGMIYEPFQGVCVVSN